MSWNGYPVIDLDSPILERADRFHRGYLDPAYHDAYQQLRDAVARQAEAGNTYISPQAPGGTLHVLVHGREKAGTSAKFLNEPGRAVAFAVGDIHPIEYGDDTFFIRVTGGDVETKKTLRFDPEAKTVEVADRARGQR